MADYLLPDVGEGLTEAEIVSWKVEVGDTVAINDIVCEIETAKSIVELPSPFAGVVSAILASACCWLPLVLIALGASGAGIAAGLEAYRPLLIVVTFGFLGAAFYLTYGVLSGQAPMANLILNAPHIAIATVMLGLVYWWVPRAETALAR